MNYHQRYCDDGRAFYFVGFEFDTKEKNISKLKWEKITLQQNSRQYGNNKRSI